METGIWISWSIFSDHFVSITETLIRNIEIPIRDPFMEGFDLFSSRDFTDDLTNFNILQQGVSLTSFLLKPSQLSLLRILPSSGSLCIIDKII